MAAGQLNHILQHMRRAAFLRDGAGMTDGQLLEVFLTRRDEAALATLVRRHAPMAWGVCRRVLRNHHDAEDAFQAIFLVLVRRATSVVPREMLANWLYGVAYRVALKARATAAHRRNRERQVSEMPEPETVSPDLWHDLRPVLDEELNRLPDKYRVPVVLCDLEGRTRLEAARQLGWPEGTVAGRLARARKLLAKALTRRGVVLSGGALAVALAESAVAAPTALVGSTVKATNLVAAGQAAGAVSARVAAMVEGVLQSMLVNKQKTVLVVLLVVLLSLGTGMIGWQTRAAESGPPSQQSPRQSKNRDEDNLKNTLLALVHHLNDASSKGDWREVEKLYAPEYVSVSLSGRTQLADCLETVKRERAKDWKMRDIEVIRAGRDAAVMTYIYSCNEYSAGGQLLRERKDHRITLVWTQRKGGWLLLYAHDEYAAQPTSVENERLLRVYQRRQVLHERLRKDSSKNDPGK
jgi:RNA polymerase sigma factor (sigma-70 family)